MPTYDEIEVSVGMMIEVANWRGPVLRASYGGGYGDSALVDNAAGLHLWTLKQAQLMGDATLVPINGLSRLDYYTQFFKDHTTGATDIFIIAYRGKKYHASFVDPDMDVTRVAFKIGNPDWNTGGGLKIKQRRVAGFTYSADGSLPFPGLPTLTTLTVVGHYSISIAWTAEVGDQTGYEVLIDETSVFDVGNVLTHTFSFFSPGTTHSFRVRSYDGVPLRSAYSNSLSGTTTVATLSVLVDGSGRVLVDGSGHALVSEV